MGLNSGASIWSRLRTLAAAGFTLVAGTGLAAAQEFVDLPHKGQMNLHEPVTEIMERLVNLHDLLLVIISVITVFVMALMIYVMVRFRASRNPVPSQVTHNAVLEIAWTVVPIIILIVIAIPSFKLLYFMDRVADPDKALTIKVTGRQWYWTYEYPDHKIEFDATLLKEVDRLKLSPAEQERRPRLLAVDNDVVLPVNTDVRFLVTSSDVMHAWAVPAFGVKHDAIIGRLNQGWFNVRKEGLYYGQCSQICGMNHAYMPIAVRVVSKAEFDKWVAAKKQAAIPAGTAPAALAGAAPAR